MRKIFNILLATVTILAMAIACNKDVPSTPGNNPEEPTAVAGETITIKATLSDALTRVKFEPSYSSEGKTNALALTWAEGDKLRVYNHADHTEYEDFTLVASAVGQQVGEFSGTAFDAASYDVDVIVGNFDYADQTQPSDGETSDLKYLASVSEITDITDIVFTSFSSVLAITAKMPSTEAAAAIKSVDITASEAIFNGGNSLTITLDTPGSEDEILNLFATLPIGNQDVPAGTTLLVHFNAPNTAHTVYTRFIELGASALTFAANTLNTLNINATKSDLHAGLTSCDGTTAAKAYLIGDEYQMAAVGSLMVADAKTYFKMISDVNMSNVSWNPLNTDGDDDYSMSVDFNGNGKSIKRLGKHMFYVLKGSVYDLTLEGSTITSRGILAEYIQGTGNVVTNVTVLNGVIQSNDSNVGGLIGCINKGQGSSAEADIQDCTVTGTTVKGNGVVGGVIGFADAKVSVSDCKFTGDNVTSSGRYVGGFVGSTGNYESTFENCQVENATINVNNNADPRGGGFVGQLQDKVLIKGCTVGTADTKVTINTKEPAASGNSYNVINVGGFVGVCYGKVTKNGDVRSTAYVKITSTNTQGTPLKLGGFVGYHAGNIEYSDAVIDMTNLKGQHIGGFAGYVIKNNATRLGRIDNCTTEGQVTGNNYTGGFAGYVDSGSPEISNSSAIGSVNAQSGCGGFVGQSMTGVFTNDTADMICSFSGSNNGGFVGQIHGGTMTGCSASGSLTRTGGSTYGGFAGLLTNNGTTLDKCSASVDVTNSGTSYTGAFIGLMESGTILINRCYATGDVTSNQAHVSSFVGRINQASGKTLNVTIENCYATGNIINSNQVRGGLVASAEEATSLKISKCYASGSIVGSFRLGGLIGNLNNSAAVVENCAAWNSEVTASSTGSANWSSGAVIGTAHPNSHLSNNYRKHDMSIAAFWVPASDYSQPDVDGTTHPLTDRNGAEMTDTAMASGQSHYPHYAYHGKVEAGYDLSWIAEYRLGWSDDIWDFSGPLPLLW